MIFKNLIQANLRTEYLGKDIEYYQIIDSTNKEAKSIINNNEATHGMMIITDNQKNGKGRLNNEWFMGPGKGLAMSIIYLKTLSIKKATLIPLASGLAIAKTLEDRGFKPKLKWPNDIILNNKKVGGILCESEIKKNIINSFIIGVGLNVNETVNDFPKELQYKATSLFIETNNSFQRELISAIITTYLERSLENFDSTISQWLLFCGHLGKKVSFNYRGNKHTGIFKGINKKGHAQIDIDGKILQFPSISLD
jgi:BirA family transcriptional regulator, biotin operon repressor / biotin---[acetyl-CoA-carboxylase] ligase